MSGLFLEKQYQSHFHLDSKLIILIGIYCLKKHNGSARKEKKYKHQFYYKEILGRDGKLKDNTFSYLSLFFVMEKSNSRVHLKNPKINTGLV